MSHLWKRSMCLVRKLFLCNSPCSCASLSRSVWHTCRDSCSCLGMVQVAHAHYHMSAWLWKPSSSSTFLSMCATLAPVQFIIIKLFTSLLSTCSMGVAGTMTPWYLRPMVTILTMCWRRVVLSLRVFNMFAHVTNLHVGECTLLSFLTNSKTKLSSETSLVSAPQHSGAIICTHVQVRLVVCAPDSTALYRSITSVMLTTLMTVVENFSQTSSSACSCS